MPPEDQQTIREYIPRMRKTESKQFKIGMFSTIIILLYLVMFLLLGLTLPNVSVWVRAAILGIPPAAAVVGIWKWVRLRSTILSSRTIIANILQKNWDWSTIGNRPQEAVRISAPELPYPAGSVPASSLSLPVEIPPEFHDAFVAWKAGDYPLDSKRSSVVIIPRDAGTFSRFVLTIVTYMSTGIFCAVTLILALLYGLLGVNYEITLIIFIVLTGAVVWVIYFLLKWRSSGIKSKVLFISPIGIMWFNWSTPLYYP